MLSRYEKLESRNQESWQIAIYIPAHCSVVSLHLLYHSFSRYSAEKSVPVELQAEKRHKNLTM